MPISTAPSTCPWAPIGLMIVPESWAALTCMTRVTPVSRSSFTRTAWQLNWGATHAAMPMSPTHEDACGGGPGGAPEPWPISNSPPAAMPASSAMLTDFDGVPATEAAPSARTMSAAEASSWSAASCLSCSATCPAAATTARPLLNRVCEPVAPMSYGATLVSW